MSSLEAIVSSCLVAILAVIVIVYFHSLAKIKKDSEKIDANIKKNLKEIAELEAQLFAVNTILKGPKE